MSVDRPSSRSFGSHLSTSFSVDRAGKEEELEELQRKVGFKRNMISPRDIICEQVEVYEEKLENIREQYKLGMDSLEGRTRKGI